MSTIIKKKKDVLSYTRHNTQEIAQSIKHGLLNLESQRPKIVFAADYRKRNGVVEMTQYCALVTLHVRNLPGREEVDNTMDRIQGSVIMRAYPNFTPTNNTCRELGRLLREKEFASKRTSKGMIYAAVKK